MTLKEAKAFVKSIGFTLNKYNGVYRLNTVLGGEPTAYYTKDLQDAVDTAKAWRAREDYESMHFVVTNPTDYVDDPTYPYWEPPPTIH